MEFLVRHFPAFLVAMPMFFAPIIALIRGKGFSWLISYAVIAFGFVCAGYLLMTVLRDGSVNYFFGGFSPPFGIEYLATTLNCYALIILYAFAFLSFPFSEYLDEVKIKTSQTPFYYAAFLMVLAGLAGVILTNDIFNAFVFLEISSIATYGLISLGENKKSTKTAFNYLILGTIGGSFFLIGIGFLYAQTGTLNITDIYNHLSNSTINLNIIAALTFILVGLGIKSAIFPLCSWVPSVYENSPSYITSFLAAFSSKASLFLLFKILLQAFGVALISALNLNIILAVMGIGGVIFGSISALYQTTPKRLLAYSSIANIGYIVLAFSFLGKLGFIAALFHLMSHAVAKGGIFLVLGASGYKKPPAGLLFICFVIFALSLIGVPLTSGFITKWYLLNAALNSGNLALAICSIGAVIIGSVASLFYMWKLYNMLEAGDNFPAIHSKFPLVILAFTSIYFGLAASGLIKFLAEVIS